ncbi:MAG: ATP-binding cassette domain-containing protein, partial [Pseudomonadota bacterium]|nr:ATP-binding cassette domain-containing protein [Pseudomonadota bacterium]
SDLPVPRRSSHQAGAVVLTVAQLALPKRHPFATELTDISFTLRAGEILGVAGISGNGQQELLGVLSGEDTRADNTMVLLDGTPIGKSGSAQRRARGIAFVPEERLGRGAVPALSLSSNILLSHQNATTLRGGLIRRGALRQIASDIIARFNVKAGGPEALAQSLSGGNLQKFIVGREIMTRPRVLIVAQPTWGVDVGAAAQIRNELIAMRDAGCAVLVISEELDELFEIADRLMVIAKGRVSEPVPIAEASVEQIGLCMAGLAAPTEPVQTVALESQHA